VGILRLFSTLNHPNSFLGNSVPLALVLAYLAPTTVGGLLATVFVDAFAGILVAIGVCIIHTMMYSRSTELLLSVLLCSCTSVFLCRKVNLRGGVVKAIFIASCAMAASIFIRGFFSQGLGILTCLQQTLACFCNGALSLFCTLTLLPVFEKIFRQTSDITLLKLSDRNCPLLRKLQMICPGTYHHSLIVANMGEQVAEEIGANALLCRCGALYHDVGKMIKPEFFNENQSDGDNPHEYYSASIGAIILKCHVKDGAIIARTYGLPQAIIDFIEQHHGTSLMQYFYQKALRQRRATDEAVNEFLYRYEGPRPQTKEVAIISLADAVEAASRSLTKVTPKNVAILIEDVFNDRFAEGQMDACPLTFAEIAKMKKRFQFAVLSSMHPRIHYPKRQSVARVSMFP
jgi:putative nucleotidyltransferase with HDIG domain